MIPAFKRTTKLLTIICSSAFLLNTAPAFCADINLGMTTALSGPAKALGEEMKLGIDAYLNKVNKEGGIKGNQLKLTALDDGYEPTKAAPNMRQLIDEKQVLAVIGNVGTPTAIVTAPIANEKATPLFGAFTGAGVLRKTPPDRYVVNYRASYAEETEAMINGLLEIGVKPEEIAFFTQNDGYGDAGYHGAVNALKAKGFSDTGKLAHGRYTRNTLNVEEGLGVLLDATTEPKAIIMVGAYAPCAKFIKLAKQEFPKALFLNVSFVGSQALLNALGGDAEGVIVTQVVPHYQAGRPLIKEYQSALSEYQPKSQPSFVSLEGYIAAKIFVLALQKADDPFSRESVVNSIEQLGSFDIGMGVPLSFSATEHQASHTVWPTIIRNGSFEPLTHWKMAYGQ